MSSLDAWLTRLAELHPTTIDLGLERVGAVWRRLHTGLIPVPVITVAGTNGKGSSVALLEAILTSAGYRCGCYSSPHLVSYTERMRIAGVQVGEAALCAAFARVDVAREGASLTEFEFGTLAAFLLFLQAEVDVWVLEVGLGGRLDAVNLIDADVALLTTVDLDHADWLGSDREAVGAEKAGVMRPGRRAVCNDPTPPASVLAYAERIGVPLWVQGRDYHAQKETEGWHWYGPDGVTLRDLPHPALLGTAQMGNAAGVLAVLHSLTGRLPCSRESIENGLRHVRLAGRMQVPIGHPELLLDVAHNPQAARELAANLVANPVGGRNLALFGLLADKDLAGVVGPLAQVIDRWFVLTLNGPRGRRSEALAAELQAMGLDVGARFDRLPEALSTCRAALRDGDRLVIFGSFYLVGDLLALLDAEAGGPKTQEK